MEGETRDDWLQLMNAFKSRHNRKHSLYKLLSELSFSSEVKSPAQGKKIHDAPSRVAHHNDNEIKSVLRQDAGVHTENFPAFAHVKKYDYPKELDPFSEVSASPDNVIDVSIIEDQQKQSMELDNAILLKLLNTYLITKDGRSVGKINLDHVKKIKKDIKNNTVIARYLIINEDNVNLTWKVKPETRDDLQKLLDAFKSRHDGRGSFYQMLTNFSFVDRGYRLINTTTHDEIINRVSEPAIHRIGKGNIVDMKRKVMLDVLKHFSSPDRHEQPLSEKVLEPLISHYGHVELDVEKAQKSAEKLASENKLSLDDNSLLDVIKRFFHRIKTDERVEQFDHALKNTALKFQEVMKKELDRVREQHAPEQVAQRVKISLSKHLKEAYEEYAQEMPGANIYPETLSNDSATAKQIYSVALKNFQIVLKEIVLRHEKVFVDNLIKGISSFSADEYFQGKSREKAVENTIKINNILSSSYEVAMGQHDANIKILNDNSKECGDHFSGELTAEFDGMKKGVANSIKEKIMENYQVAFNLYNREVDNITTMKKGFSAEMKIAKALDNISTQLVKDVEKIHKNKLTPDLNINNSTFRDEIGIMEKSVLDNIITRIPKTKSIGKTLKSALARAFRPTPAKILGSIPLVGGLAFSLAALPTAVAIPVGIAAAVVLPVALLGWIAFNIHKRFSQRSEIKELSQQIKQRFQQNIV